MLHEHPMIFPGDHSISLAVGPVPGCRCISSSLAAECGRQKCCHGGMGIGGGRCPVFNFLPFFLGYYSKTADLADKY